MDDYTLTATERHQWVLFLISPDAREITLATRDTTERLPFPWERS